MEHTHNNGGLDCPLLETQGSMEDEVVVLVLDGSARSQTKQGIAQALKGCGQQQHVLEQAAKDSELLAQWQGQGPILLTWLLSSLVAAVFAPILVPSHPILLPALTAAALGLVAPLVHLLSNRLAASQVLELQDQVSLVSACALAAGCVDLLAMIMAVSWAWCATSQPADAAGVPDMRPLLVAAFNCWQHGVVAVTVMQSMGMLPGGRQE